MGPQDGTLGWDPGMGPWDGTLGWDPRVYDLGFKVQGLGCCPLRRESARLH